MYKLLACLLFATSLPAMAQIYEYIDAQGNKAYTNQPPPTGVIATPVDLPPTNVVDVPDIPPPAAPSPSVNQQPANPPTNNAANPDDEEVQYGTDYGYDHYRQPGPAGADAVGLDPGRGHAGSPRADPVGADPGRGAAGSVGGDAAGRGHAGRR